MTIRLILKVVGAASLAQEEPQEQVFYEFHSDQYPPEDFDALIFRAIDAASLAAGEHALSNFRPELVVALFVDGEPMRAAMHLSAAAVRKLADAGASLDFDPYIYA